MYLYSVKYEICFYMKQTTNNEVILIYTELFNNTISFLLYNIFAIFTKVSKVCTFAFEVDYL